MNANSEWLILKRALILGTAATLTTISCFWTVFVTVVTGTYIIHRIYIPPRFQTFPISFDYDPYYLVDNRNDGPVYGIRNLPPGLRHPVLDRELTFNEDNPLFRAYFLPDAALGFTDIALNVSGLQVPADPHRGRLGRLLRLPLALCGFGSMPRNRMSALRDFPLEIALIFQYNSRGFCGTADGTTKICTTQGQGWFDTPSVQPIDVRSAFYSGQGQKVLEIATAFFPSKQTSRLQDAAVNVASAIVDLALYFLPISTDQLASPGWASGTVTLFENVVLSDLTARRPLESARWLKLRISPKLPVRSAAVVFQAKATGIAAWLQTYPTTVTIGTAFFASSCVAVGVAAGSSIVIAVCLVYTSNKKKRD